MDRALTLRMNSLIGRVERLKRLGRYGMSNARYEQILHRRLDPDIARVRALAAAYTPAARAASPAASLAYRNLEVEIRFAVALFVGHHPHADAALQQMRELGVEMLELISDGGVGAAFAHHEAGVDPVAGGSEIARRVGDITMSKVNEYQAYITLAPDSWWRPAPATCALV